MTFYTKKLRSKYWPPNVVLENLFNKTSELINLKISKNNLDLGTYHIAELIMKV